MKRITIGILAGMGPRSTSPFLELVLDQCQEQYGAKYDIDYPHIIIYSLPTPFYIDKETNEEDLRRSIREGIERLQECGIDLIGIPCNSAHSYFKYITENVTVPVLNIVDETLYHIERGSRVSIFATEMTRKAGLYQKGIIEKGCEYIFEEKWQESINQIIIKIKNKEDLTETKLIWERLISEAVDKGIEKIIIACTDLNVVLDVSNTGIEYIDSSKALAKSLIKKYIYLNAQ